MVEGAATAHGSPVRAPMRPSRGPAQRRDTRSPQPPLLLLLLLLLLLPLQPRREQGPGATARADRRGGSMEPAAPTIAFGDFPPVREPSSSSLGATARAPPPLAMSWTRAVAGDASRLAQRTSDRTADVAHAAAETAAPATADVAGGAGSARAGTVTGTSASAPAPAALCAHGAIVSALRDTECGPDGPPLLVRGFVNAGSNACFAHAVLVALLHGVPPLVQALRAIGRATVDAAHQQGGCPSFSGDTANASLLWTLVHLVAALEPSAYSRGNHAAPAPAPAAARDAVLRLWCIARKASQVRV